MLAARSFEYRSARSVDEAVDLLAFDGAHALAGGTDLVLLRSSGTLDASRLVDVKRIASLAEITAEEGVIRIGSAATLDHVSRSLAPSALVDGASLVGGWQTRCRATLGGNICRASPAGDTLCGLLVDDASLHLQSVHGERDVPVRDFFTGPGRTVRRSEELLVRIDLPASGGASAYARFTYRNAMDLAVVGVAARISLAGGVCEVASIAIGASGPTPMLVPDAAAQLVGSTVDEQAVAVAAAVAAGAARPIDDVRGTADFRRRALEPLARRVIREARRRATVIAQARR